MKPKAQPSPCWAEQATSWSMIWVPRPAAGSRSVSGLQEHKDLSVPLGSLCRGTHCAGGRGTATPLPSQRPANVTGADLTLTSDLQCTRSKGIPTQRRASTIQQINSHVSKPNNYLSPKKWLWKHICIGPRIYFWLLGDSQLLYWRQSSGNS